MMPPKLAIIGGGPSAFYLASRLFSLVGPASQLRVHIFDRLWAPHGLVRYGVAPDHPEVKNCTHKFDLVGADPRFRFFGNVEVGSPSLSFASAIALPLSSLFQNYTHIVFATGCTEPTLHPSIQPSPYCVPALSLVHWYTQHPSQPPPPPLEKLSHVTIIGVGNVSLDIARILLSPVSLLVKYDVPAPVLDVLSRSQIKHVSIMGRRGPLEAAFTTKELRELINLPSTSLLPIPNHLTTTSSSLTRQQSRILQLLQKGSPTLPPTESNTTHRTWSLDFFRSPAHLALPPSPSDALGLRPLADLTVSHTTLDPTHTRALPTSARTVLPTSLVVTSLGFHASPSLPFYNRSLGHIRTDAAGRILHSSSLAREDTKEPAVENVPLKNVYASGWAATGAKGVLASTMMNAYSLAETILSDWSSRDKNGHDSRALTCAESDYFGPFCPNPEAHLHILPPPEVQKGLQEGIVTTYEDWKIVDHEEIRRGEAIGKERERMDWGAASAFLAAKKS